MTSLSVEWLAASASEAVPAGTWCGSTQTALHGASRRLRLLRAAGWLVFIGEFALLAACWRLVATGATWWMHYLWTLAAVVAWFHGLPFLLNRLVTPVAARVLPAGDRWRIGNYSEAELREVIGGVAAGLPSRARRLRVCIVDVRGVAAWTWLSLFRPSFHRAKSIMLSSGSLYYLDREELAAVLLHEIAHHLPGHRAGVCGGWVLADVAWHAAAFMGYCLTGSESLAVLVFILLRWLGLAVAVAAIADLSRSIEHLCDLYAAERAGSVPLVNALLKLGEDDELSEVVQVWAAREMLLDADVCRDDLALAFAESRPYGRIFHESLIRHACEVSKIVHKWQGPPRKPREGAKENPYLKEFVESRRQRQRRRIRWRRFDGDGDGRLTAEEIGLLCESMLARPDHALFTSQMEAGSATHPSCRERILLVHGAIGAIA